MASPHLLLVLWASLRLFKSLYLINLPPDLWVCFSDSFWLFILNEPHFSVSLVNFVDSWTFESNNVVNANQVLSLPRVWWFIRNCFCLLFCFVLCLLQIIFVLEVSLRYKHRSSHVCFQPVPFTGHAQSLSHFFHRYNCFWMS